MRRIGVIWLSIILALSAFLVIPAGEDVKGGFDGEPNVIDMPGTPSSSAQGLGHHWKLDETSGNIAYDSGGADHGLIVGALINQTGKNGTSYWFDGSDDYVEIDDNVTLDFPLGDDFGIFAWINTTSQNGRIMSKREVPGDATGYLMTVQSGKFGVYLDFGATGAYLESTANIADGLWHRVGMTRIGNTLEAFVDGGSIGIDTNAGGDLSNDNPLLFGVEQDLSLDYTGYLDDVSFIDDLPPIADAGPNQNVLPQSLVAFDGSASVDDMGITNYWWNFTYGGPQSLTGVNPSFVFDNLGLYTVTLTVMDTIGQTGSDIIEVNVAYESIYVDFLTDLDKPKHGTVTGTHVLTHVLDGSTQQIQEVIFSTKSAPGATPLSPGPGPNPSAQVYYTDRPTFDADAGPLPFFEDFEEANVPPPGENSFTGPLDQFTNNGIFQWGDIEPGIRFVDNPGPDTDDMVVMDVGFGGNPTITVCTNTFTDSMDIYFFNNDVWAFGIELQSYWNPTTIDIEIYGVGGVLLDTTTAQSNNVGLFWGVISDELITRINLFTPTETEGGDNIAFGNPDLCNSLDHVWRTESIDPGAANLTLFVNARTNTGADDKFIFAYSEDEIVWNPTGIIVDTDVMTEYSLALPLVSGPLYLRVFDNNRDDLVLIDTLYVDHIRVEWFGFPPYELPLNEGWNLISLPLEQSNPYDIPEVLDSIGGKWDCIRAYDPSFSDPWIHYNVNWPMSLNDLDGLNHKIGFWINITEPNVNLTVRGYIPSSTSIPLHAGWNLVGYPSLNTETVANALWGTGADAVTTGDASEPYHIKEVAPTYVMKPGEGYWIHVPADTVWIVDW